MKLSTQYLGLTLSNPFILGACPLSVDLEAIKRVVDAGAAAVVMHSLFEEQLSHAAMSHPKHSDPTPNLQSTPPSQPNSGCLLPSFEYLEQLANIKRAVHVPVIASLNGSSDHGWLYCARQLESAGADALELNVYRMTIDPAQSAADVEQQLLSMVHNVTRAVTIPVAIKLFPFYSALPHLAHQLISEGARGLVLFNRVYEADFDVEARKLAPTLHLSDSSELPLRLRWISALSPALAGSIAVSGGVHSGHDALKAIMAGAHAVQLVSAVLRRGPSVFADLKSELETWLRAHECDSLDQIHGCMNLASCPDTSYNQRGNYLKVLQSYPRRSPR